MEVSEHLNYLIRSEGALKIPLVNTKKEEGAAISGKKWHSKPTRTQRGADGTGQRSPG